MNEAWNRREFLKIGSSFLATASMPRVSKGGAKESPKKRLIHKAVMYGTITFPGSVLDRFQALKVAGFEGVEPMSHMNQEEVIKGLEETGLKVPSVCCSTHWSKPLSHPDENVRHEGLEGIRQTLKDAHRYGASSILVVPGVVTKGVSYDDCFHRSVAELRKVLPLAMDLGVKIAIENVWNNFVTDPKQAVAFLDAIDSPQVGWHFDIGNTLRYSLPETWIPVLGKRILKLHIKEYSKEKGFGVHFFEGDNNWPAIMKALDEVGYQGWGMSEQPGDQSKDALALKDLSERMDRIYSS